MHGVGYVIRAVPGMAGQCRKDETRLDVAAIGGQSGNLQIGMLRWD